MKRLHLLFSLLFVISLTHLTLGQVAKTAVCSAGNLSTIASSYLSTVTNLTVTGTIDARDFKTMRDNMLKLDTIDLSSATVVEYTGTEGTIGEYVNTYQANAIPAYAFYNGSIWENGKKLKSFKFPSQITRIGLFAFSYCYSLSGSLILPSLVEIIEQYAFFNCYRLDGSLSLPPSIKTIESNAFQSCNAFTGTTVLSASLTSIGQNAFLNFGATIEVNANNPNYSSLEGVLFNKDKTSLIQYPYNKTGSYTIPNTVTTIETYAFYQCNNLTGTITIPNSVTTIKEYAFAYCYNLTGKLTLPTSLTTLRNDAFSDCSKLTGSLIIPSSLTTIGNYAFNNCSGLTGTITIPSTITNIGSVAFGSTKCLFVVDANNSNYSNSADGVLFNKNKTTIIQFPTSLSGSYTIPSTVTAIEYQAFTQCTNLTGTITIPETVTTINDYAFYRCSKLSAIATMSVAPISLYSSVFYEVNKSTCQLFVPSGSKAAYAAANGWNEFLNIIDSAPTTPVASSASEITGNSFTANWSAALYTANYYLDVAKDNAFTQLVTGYTNLNINNVLTYNISGLSPATPYFYRVRAVNMLGESSNSNSIALTTLKQDQTITFTAPATKPFGSAPYTVTATGGTSGTPIIFTSSDNTIATCTGVNGSTITIVGAGSCTINANQAASATHNAAPQVSQPLHVNAGIIYVKPTKDVAIWQSKSNVYSSLQDALAKASVGDEIWIAAGTYYPTADTAKLASFKPIDGITLLGGFAGNETKKEQRNWRTNKTILSGNINDKTIATDNSYHVVDVNSTRTGLLVTLDGLTISDGNGVGANNNGGAIVSKGGNVRVINCCLENNTAYAGGAVAGTGDATTFEFANCIFRNNLATYYGSILYQPNTPSYFYNCVFTKNESKDSYSKIIVSNGKVYNSIFWDNKMPASEFSYHYNYYDLTYYNCLLQNGALTNGCLTSNPSFIDTNFNLNTNSPCLENGNINPLPYWLGEDYNGVPRVAGKRVDIGIYEAESKSAPNILFPIDQQIISPSTLELKWSYNNSSEVVSGYTIEVTIDNGTPEMIETENVNSYSIDVVKLTYQYSFRVKAKHQNSNSAWSPITTQYVDNGRIIYVRSNATGDGSSWNNAFGKLEDALDTAYVSDQIWVAKGSYSPSESSTYKLKQGVKLYGGFAGNETATAQRNWSKNATMLSSSSMVVTGKDNSISNHQAVLDGFTIADGKGDYYSAGSGLFLSNFNIIISNCLITRNTGSYSGSGIYSYNSQVDIYNTIISNNTCSGAGGGVFVSGGNVRIFNTLVYKNLSKYQNSSIYSDAAGHCALYNTIVSENRDLDDKSLTNINSLVLLNNSFVGDTTAGVLKNGLYIDTKSPCINKGNLAYVNPKLMAVDYYGNPRIKGGAVEIGPFEIGNETPILQSPLNGEMISNKLNNNIALKWSCNDTIQKSFDVEFWPSQGATTLVSNIQAKELIQSLPNGDISWRVRYTGALGDSAWSTPFVFQNISATKRIYVKQGAQGDGTSWANAFATIQSAIAIANTGDEIWVAAGTYFPSYTNDKSESFNITKPISVIGGFKGDETDKSQRNIELNRTILSGNIGKLNDFNDNSKTILNIKGVIGASKPFSCVIDGFCFEKSYSGSTINIQDLNPIIENCIFRFSEFMNAYTATIYCLEAAPIIKNCLFYKNNLYSAKAVYSYNNNPIAPSILNCTFASNYIYSNSPIIYSRWDNKVKTIVKNSIFWEHSTFYSEIMKETENCITTNCSFEEAAASSTSIFGNPLFKDAANGDYSLAANSPCINRGDNSGIDMATDFALKPRIVGGVIDLGYIESNIPKVQLIEPVKSNILQMFTNKVSTLRWNDTEYLASKKYMTQYWIKGSADTTKTTLSIEQSTPLFTILPYQEYQWRVGVFSTELNDYSWSETESFFTGKGNPIFVKEGATGDGSSWNSAFGSLSSALAIAKNGDQIWVAKGTYYPSATNDRTTTFNISANIQLLGGFVGNETDAFFRNSALNKTILSGNIGSKTDATDNSMQLFKITGTDINQTMTIDGFTISDSYNTDKEFGAFNIVNCSPTISNCIISHNQSKSIAGLLIESGNPTITNSLIVHNVSAEIGCAIKSDKNSKPTIINCTIAQNESKGNSAIKGDATVSNSIIYHNLNTLGYISIDKATVTYSCIENIAFGHDNIYADPTFEEQTNFTLNPFSPCFNKGSKDASTPLYYDLGLKNRIAFGQVDMGANEIQSTSEIEIIAITPSNKSTQVDINPTIEIKFNTDVKVNDASKIFVANRLNSLEQLPTNSSNTLRFKTTTLDFDKLYTLVVESNSYQLVNNELIAGNDTTITFTTRSCQNGVVSVKLANDGKCINNILVVEPTISGDIKTLPTWYIDGNKLPWSGYNLDISELKANQVVRYTNTDMCGNTMEATLNMEDTFEPMEIVKKWDDVLIINNGDHRFDNYKWTVNGSEISTDQYIQVKSSVDGYVVVSANELKSNCRIFSDSIQFKLDNLSKIEVFPNPVSAMKSITIHSKNQISITSIKLIDMNGSVVSEQVYNQEAQLFDFSKTDVTPGVYFIEINSNNTKTTQKIVVTH